MDQQHIYQQSRDLQRSFLSKVLWRSLEETRRTSSIQALATILLSDCLRGRILLPGSKPWKFSRDKTKEIPTVVLYRLKEASTPPLPLLTLLGEPKRIQKSQEVLLGAVAAWEQLTNLSPPHILLFLPRRSTLLLISEARGACYRS